MTPKTWRHRTGLLAGAILGAVAAAAIGARGEEPAARVYLNRLVPLENPPPLLADFPQYVEPVMETRRFEAPVLVDDEDADLHVRAWRFSYNARGIVELPNRLRAADTAVIVVHPWGIDDGQGWNTPEPAGAADFCTPEKNRLAGAHTREVIDPLLERLRPRVGLVMVSLRGAEQLAHRKRYRSIRRTPSATERAQGRREMEETLEAFDYRGEAIPERFEVSRDLPVADYFRQFPGLEAGDRVNNVGFWDLPVPVCADITLHDDDVVIYDADGYAALRDFLRAEGIRHVLLTGYATDMCFCETTAGYKNLSRDFNVFLVGDATLATFPASASPRHATNAHVAFASLDQLITQTSWIRLVEAEEGEAE